MKVLVTGGGGFLGKAIVDQLVARGDTVRILARGHYPALEAMGVEALRGDIASTKEVEEAVRGMDAVIHTAAKAGVWGSYDSYHQPNVEGTRNVLSACRSQGVPKLVHTSSPSVVYDGTDQAGVDESAPYPETFLAHYPHTKSQAEAMVLEAHGPDLATVALRPHLIWGPGDPHLLPRMVERQEAGALKRISGGPHLVDSVYVDNAADAHILALDKLSSDSIIGGRAYFISNDEPMDVWELVDQLLATQGLGPVTGSVPAEVAITAGTVLEFVYHLFRLKGEPRMTRFTAKQLSTAHWFDLSAAREQLGYEPRVSIAQGLERLSATHQGS